MFRCVSISFVCMVLCVGAIAKSNIDLPTWPEDTKRLEKMSGEEFCSERWEILWQWAKKGNLEARYFLLILNAPPPDMLPMRMPGNHGDTISRLKDILIMSIHSVDYQDKNDSRDYYRDLTIGLFRQFQLDQTLSGEKFMQCVNSKKSTNCAKLAVEEKLVPSFDDYAANIDLLIANGEAAICR